jgi:hypothetical protein
VGHGAEQLAQARQRQLDRAQYGQRGRDAHEHQRDQHQHAQDEAVARHDCAARLDLLHVGAGLADHFADCAPVILERRTHRTVQRGARGRRVTRGDRGHEQLVVREEEALRGRV